jgi:hypothetical protein
MLVYLAVRHSCSDQYVRTERPEEQFSSPAYPWIWRQYASPKSWKILQVDMAWHPWKLVNTGTEFVIRSAMFKEVNFLDYSGSILYEYVPCYIKGFHSYDDSRCGLVSWHFVVCSVDNRSSAVYCPHLHRTDTDTIKQNLSSQRWYPRTKLQDVSTTIFLYYLSIMKASLGDSVFTCRLQQTTIRH